MQIPFYSLRTGILAYLALLIICAMILINIVMVKFSERDLIRARLSNGRLILHTLEQKAGLQTTRSNESWNKLSSNPRFKKDIEKLLNTGGYSGVLIIDRSGNRAFSSGEWGKMEKAAFSLSREALLTKNTLSAFSGHTWGVIWLARERINIAGPLIYEGNILGAAAISASLVPLYQEMRESEKIILFYILLNTMLLVLVGFYLLSRTVVKPIQRLLRVTEQFKEGEPLPSIQDSSRNEIGRLSRSLTLMLKRLEENKEELRDHISSLEKANLEIKKAQEEIVRSEKLASVGRLAMGVAHEIGNPLGIVLGYLELLREKDLSRAEKRDFLDRIESEITRISQIIRQLLDFSKPTSGKQKQVNIHNIIRETLDMLSPQPMLTHIKINPDFQAAEEITSTDPDQLRQVFLNVIMNAAHAMIRDKDSTEKDFENTLSIKTLDTEGWIELRFEDTGPGISEEDLRHIFDPFYTTKDPGQGSGLGLSVCYMIMERLGGSIRAESTLGQGATIIIKIPLEPIKDKAQD